jgi:hypothetical protein
LLISFHGNDFIETVAPRRSFVRKRDPIPAKAISAKVNRALAYFFSIAIDRRRELGGINPLMPFGGGPGSSQ